MLQVTSHINSLLYTQPKHKTLMNAVSNKQIYKPMFKRKVCQFCQKEPQLNSKVHERKRGGHVKYTQAQIRRGGDIRALVRFKEKLSKIMIKDH